MKHQTLISATFALASFALSNAVHAEQDPLVSACKEDVAKLCPDVKPGEGRIAACLKAHKREVSSGCKKAALQHRREKRGAEKEAPEANDGH